MTRAERTEVVTAQEVQPPSNVVNGEDDAMMALISRAATDPSFDADKFERLMTMRERMGAQRAKAQYTAALAEMQPKLPVIDERGGISTDKGKTVQSTYAKWEDINDAIRPVLHAHGFALSFRIGRTEGQVTVKGVLSHAAGHSEETTLDLPVDGSGSKNSVQAVGSSVSYGKRYTAIALLNITSRYRADRDDDGDAAGTSGAAQKAIAAINTCEDYDALKAWRADHFEGVCQLVNERERKDIIALYNRRRQALNGGAAQ